MVGHMGRAGLAVILAVASSAGAQDACLNGAATLGDQRALAALQAAIAGDCPCASFSGAAGRHHYLGCAREEITKAVRADALRAECEKTARATVRGTACGSKRVPCGIDAPPADDATCRLAAAKGTHACADRRGLLETPCNAAMSCADVVQWTAGTCIDPRQPGPYGVGVRTVEMTKDSVVSPGTPRVLDTIVWYPTAAGAGPVDPTLHGVVNAPMDLSAAPYPLLMFSHGSCGYPAQSTFLTPLLASYGIVVAAPPHPGNTIFDGLTNCGTTSALIASLQERPSDIIFATDQLLAASADDTSPFFDGIDPQRIGMSGHSFGGLTTYLVTARDARYRIAVPMAPATLNNSALTVPSLTMFGDADTVVNLNNIRAAYDRSGAPKIEVVIAHTGHYAFSDGCFPSADCNPPTTLTQSEAHADVQRWVVPFVLRYLVGDLRDEPFLDNVPPGVSAMQVR
jgi:predicted dienelactone hydrolase